MTLVRVPAGMYDMGKYAGERAGGLVRAHSIQIGYRRCVLHGLYEVTQQQWLALMSIGKAPIYVAVWHGICYCVLGRCRIL